MLHLVLHYEVHIGILINDDDIICHILQECICLSHYSNKKTSFVAKASSEVHRNKRLVNIVN